MKKIRSVPALLLLFAACKSTGVDQAEAAAQSMREMKQALADAPEKITAVSASLEDLTKEGGDMKAEYATFSGHLDKLVDHRERLRSLGNEVKASREIFTAAWEKRMQTITDEDLRKRAEERRAAVVTRFGELTKVAESGKQEFDPWMDLVVQVRTYLENDLNPTGVASVSDKVREIRNGANSVNKKIETVVKGLDDMSQAIAAAKPPPEPAPAEGPSKK